MLVQVNRERTASDILLSLEGAHLEVWKLSGGTICVLYDRCEVKDGPVLKGVFGRGDTFEGACHDYLQQISGKTLVFNACSDHRREVTVLG